jgi:hypothetical protein
LVLDFLNFIRGDNASSPIVVVSANFRVLLRGK